MWDAARIAEARELFDAGYSAREAAGRLGVSRSAVFGIWRRQGFCRARPTVRIARYGNPSGSSPPVRVHLARFREMWDLAAARRRSRAFVVPDADPALPPNARPVTLLQLSGIGDLPGHCRFVIGEARGAETLFYGAGREQARVPYCPFHMKRAAGEGTPSEQRASELPAGLR
jgi:hypothetical protein